jgi:sugar lactone lactonase YvrE
VPSLPSARDAGIKTFATVVASERAYGLAEGPLWDDALERVLWVDINAGDVHIGRLSDGLVWPETRLSFAETVGAVACAVDGRLLVAGQRQLHLVDTDGGRTVLADVIPAGKDSRLNDGACDPAGHFLVGSLALDGRKREECLYRLTGGGDAAIVDGDLTLSNGLGWSPDGTVLYSVDTTPGVVWARPYDPVGGDWGERALALIIDDGSPDGLCVDTDGNLWIAIWGAGQVRCYTPTGDCVATVDVPAPHTSSVAFVGPGLDTLLITTAREQLSGAQLEAFPLSGHLFTAQVDLPGLPATPWSGPLR